MKNKYIIWLFTKLIRQFFTKHYVIVMRMPNTSYIIISDKNNPIEYHETLHSSMDALQKLHDNSCLGHLNFQQLLNKLDNNNIN